MFLRHRSRQAECFDLADRPVADIAQDYQQLARVNRLFRHTDPFTRFILRSPHPESWLKAQVLEVGAGIGQLSTELQAWNARRGGAWEMTCLDLNATGLALNPIPRKVQGDATRLPFPNGAVDWVIASQMTHHLDDEGVVQHFREAWRVARRAIVISDLHRNPFLLALVGVSTLALGLHPRLRSDGRISVRRGFRVPEWVALARAAGIPDPRVHVEFGCRIILAATRDPVPARSTP